MKTEKEKSNELQETQRYGRNKASTINHAYINSGHFRNKFDQISNNKILNRKVYQIAKKMLNHRSGTLLEDMYWIDLNTLEIIASETEQKLENQINYSKTTQKAIAKHKKLLVIHTHPNSMPPSINDFNSAFKNHYRICLVCCHDGKLFLYKSQKYVLEFLYKSIITKYKKMGYDEFDSQMLALQKLQLNGDISFREVL